MKYHIYQTECSDARLLVETGMDTTSYRLLSSSKCSLSVDAYIMTMRMMQLRNASFLVPFPVSSSHHLDCGQFLFSLKIVGRGKGKNAKQVNAWAWLWTWCASVACAGIATCHSLLAMSRSQSCLHSYLFCILDPHLSWSPPLLPKLNWALYIWKDQNTQQLWETPKGRGGKMEVGRHTGILFCYPLSLDFLFLKKRGI